MALIRLDHSPATVKVNTPLNIILPDPGAMGKQPVRERKVLYLLHGLSDDASAWQRYSSIETYANAYGLVVVMPSVGRSFYIDQPNGQQYFTYLTEELPQYLSDVFDLRPKREDTLIAGLSMGGYGVMKTAFHYPERFCAAASFSGVLLLDILKHHPDDARKDEFSLLFGDLNQIQGSVHDPMVWYQNAAEDPGRLPRLFISCGRQDDLYQLNKLAVAAFSRLSIPVDYYEEDARHDWLFWDPQIRRFLKAVLGEPPQAE
jgi:putative tributyrin esterase